MRTKTVPNDYLRMSCGGIGIVLRPSAPIQSLFHRNLEEDRKSPAADSGRAYGRGLGCEGSLGELGLELGDALVGIDGKAGLLLQDHSGHEGVLSVSHDEGHLHLATAGLLRKQLGLRVVGTDERIAGILVQLLGLLKVTLASSIERCKRSVWASPAYATISNPTIEISSLVAILRSFHI